MTNETIQNKLTEKFGEKLTEWESPYGLLSFRAPAQMNVEVLEYLFNEPTMRFQFMTDLTGVHFPDRKGEELSVVYHLHNLVDNIRLRMKIYAPVTQPDVNTASKLFSAANWMERETYDFFGINFVGHPNLIRILNVDEMDYFPMRKEYEMEDPTRRDKDDEMFGRG